MVYLVRYLNERNMVPMKDLGVGELREMTPEEMKDLDGWYLISPGMIQEWGDKLDDCVRRLNPPQSKLDDRGRSKPGLRLLGRKPCPPNS